VEREGRAISESAKFRGQAAVGGGVFRSSDQRSDTIAIYQLRTAFPGEFPGFLFALDAARLGLPPEFYALRSRGVIAESVPNRTLRAQA
jgi:hypothetical protein